jgi:hypothetical protein
MAWHEPDDAARKLRAQLREAQRALEVRLRTRDLGRDQVNEQSYSDLKVSLEEVNRLLNDPLQLDDPADGLDVTDFPVAIRQYLEDRKALILNRLQELAVWEQFGDFEEIVTSQVDDEKQRAHLLGALQQERNVKKEEEAELRSELNALRQKRTIEATESQILWARERNAIRHSWITRESVASLMGSLLLVVLSATMIIAMFTRTPIIDVVANSFLLILGYFFGSSMSTNLRKDDSPNGP